MPRRKGPSSVDQGNGPPDHLAAERQAQVVALRLAGWEFADIAKEVGYRGKQGAYAAWKTALANIPRPTVEKAREEAELRLNALLKGGVWEKACKGDTWSIDRVLAIEKRRAELKGLDAVKSDVSAQNVRRTYELVRYEA
jgi:hypothetical protein